MNFHLDTAEIYIPYKHVAVALRVIEALWELDHAERVERVIGCEVRRALDWRVDFIK